MKIGRNEQCHCGSGKKYKKCCLGKEEREQEERMEMYNALMNMRANFMRRKPQIKAYNKAKKIFVEIVGNMAEYYDSGKFVPEVTNESKPTGEPEKLTLLESEFSMQDDLSINAFFDTQIYKCSPNVSCITEEYIKKNKFKNADKVAMLNAMLGSTLGLFEIENVDSGEGYVYIKEVFTGKKFKMTDVMLSGSYNEDNPLYLYTRIIIYNGISFSSGLCFVFEREDLFIQDFIKRHKKDYRPLGEFVRFTELYNRYSKRKK